MATCWRSRRRRIGPAAPSTNANAPTPIPQARASGSRSPNDRLVGPRRPSVASGNAGHGMRLVDPRSRREKASTPIANRTIVTSATSPSESQSGWPISGWWWTVQPNQVRFASAREGGDRRLVAVEEVATDEHGPGDPGRRPTPDERRQGERDRARGERHEADPQGEPDGIQRRDLVAGQRAEEGAGHPGRDGDDDHHDEHPGQVREQLLDRDPAQAERGHGDELHAAAP